MTEDQNTVKKLMYNLKKHTDKEKVYAMAIAVKNQSDAALLPETFHDACMLYIALTNKIYEQYKCTPDQFEKKIHEVYDEMTRELGIRN